MIYKGESLCQLINFFSHKKNLAKGHIKKKKKKIRKHSENKNIIQKKITKKTK